jgi:DNA polymerase III epsilon subunit-like protein
LEQIQAVIVQLLQEDDVIVGHSLENDLRALHLVHDRVVDTAVLFKGHDGRKYSLKHLTATLLKRSIQDNGGNGHCSAEDAVASLELALKRAQEGPNFRIYEAADSQVHLFECLNNEQDKPIVCVGPSEWLRTHVVPFASTAHALTCETVQDDNRKAVSAWLVSHRKRARLVWAKLITKNDQASIDAINEAIVSINFVLRVFDIIAVFVFLTIGCRRM